MNIYKEKILKDYPNMISYENNLKIIQQMARNICKFKIGREQGTGFFCKIPFPDLNNMLTVFITNNHIISEEILNKNNFIIEIDIKEENDLIKLNLNNRKKYTDKNYDITIIEIKPNDNIKYFLELDDIIINDIIRNINKTKEFIDETIYVMQYPKGKLFVSYGILDKLIEGKKFEFSHKCATENGSSGSPILNINNNKVIGIHKERHLMHNYNKGTFLNYPIKEFIQRNYVKNTKNDFYSVNIINENKLINYKIDEGYSSKPNILYAKQNNFSYNPTISNTQEKNQMYIKPQLNVQLIFQNDLFNELDMNDFRTKLLKGHENDKESIELLKLKEIQQDLLLMGDFGFSLSELDCKANKISGWGINEKRGNRPYYPPIGWIGFGLKVEIKFDEDSWLWNNNGPGEWSVAYYGNYGREQSSDMVKRITGIIYKNGFKVGHYQPHKDCQDIYHLGKKVGEGIYCYPNPEIAGMLGGISGINGKKYKTILMVRVRPDAIRSCNCCNKGLWNEYWLVNATIDEIRPYRILFKEC